MQERHNSIANALELRLSCTNPLGCAISLIIAHAKHSCTGAWLMQCTMLQSLMYNIPTYLQPHGCIMRDADTAGLAAQWQRLHLQEKCGDLDPYQRSDVIRQQLEQVEWSRAANVYVLVMVILTWRFQIHDLWLAQDCQTLVKTFYAWQWLVWKCIFDNFLEFWKWLHKEVLLVLPYFSLVLLRFHRLWNEDRQFSQSLDCVSNGVTMVMG